MLVSNNGISLLYNTQHPLCLYIINLELDNITHTTSKQERYNISKNMYKIINIHIDKIEKYPRFLETVKQKLIEYQSVNLSLENKIAAKYLPRIFPQCSYIDCNELCLRTRDLCKFHEKRRIYRSYVFLKDHVIKDLVNIVTGYLKYQ